MISPDSMSTEIMITRLGRFLGCSAPVSAIAKTAKKPQKIPIRTACFQLMELSIGAAGSLYFEYQDLRFAIAVLGSRHEVSIQLGNQTRRFRYRSGRHRTQQLVVVGIGLLINIYSAIASRVDSLLPRVEHHVVRPFGNRHSLEFLAARGVENHHLSIPAPHK